MFFSFSLPPFLPSLPPFFLPSVPSLPPSFLPPLLSFCVGRRGGRVSVWHHMQVSHWVMCWSHACGHCLTSLAAPEHLFLFSGNNHGNWLPEAAWSSSSRSCSLCTLLCSWKCHTAGRARSIWWGNRNPLCGANTGGVSPHFPLQLLFILSLACGVRSHLAKSTYYGVCEAGDQAWLLHFLRTVGHRQVHTVGLFPAQVIAGRAVPGLLLGAPAPPTPNSPCSCFQPPELDL